jgi:hypothetical protein
MVAGIFVIKNAQTTFPTSRIKKGVVPGRGRFTIRDRPNAGDRDTSTPRSCMDRYCPELIEKQGGRFARSPCPAFRLTDYGLAGGVIADGEDSAAGDDIAPPSSVVFL